MFCQIVINEELAQMVYKDDRFLSFLDKRQLTRGNCLVIPRKHYKWVDDVEEFGSYFEVARKVGKAAQRAFKAAWTQYLTIGHEVAHAHIRVIPRYKRDLHGPVPDLSKIENFDESEMREIAEQIRRKIGINNSYEN